MKKVVTMFAVALLTTTSCMAEGPKKEEKKVEKVEITTVAARYSYKYVENLPAKTANPILNAISDQVDHQLKEDPKRKTVFVTKELASRILVVVRKDSTVELAIALGEALKPPPQKPTQEPSPTPAPTKKKEEKKK